MIKLKVIIASTRDNRAGGNLANQLFELIQKNKEFDSQLLDLNQFNLPFYTDATLPIMRDKPYDNPAVNDWAEKIAEGEAFIVITPEYNHSFPAPLKNALDYLNKQWNNKPIAFIGYGGASGASRAIEQLRQVVIELQMAPIRESIILPRYRSLLDEQGKLKDDLTEIVEDLLSQLLWWAKALKAAREQVATPV